MLYIITMEGVQCYNLFVISRTFLCSLLVIQNRDRFSSSKLLITACSQLRAVLKP